MSEFIANKVKIIDPPSSPTDGVNLQYLEDQLALIGERPSIARYEFRMDNGLAAGLTDVNVWEHKGLFNKILVSDDAHLIRTMIRIQSVVTAGTIDIKFRYTEPGQAPVIMTPVNPANNLDLQLAPNPADDEWQVKHSPSSETGYDIEEYSTIEVLATTSATFAPVTASFEVILFALLEG